MTPTTVGRGPRGIGHPGHDQVSDPAEREDRRGPPRPGMPQTLAEAELENVVLKQDSRQGPASDDRCTGVFSQDDTHAIADDAPLSAITAREKTPTATSCTHPPRRPICAGGDALASFVQTRKLWLIRFCAR